MTTRGTWLRAGLALAAACTIAGIAIALQHGASNAAGPRPIVWGEEACAHCRMHVSEPRFAAQVVLPEGQALNFDDPGCLLLHLEGAPATGATLYFHHAREERWLQAPRVAFAPGDSTPMGYGLVAVDPGTPKALTFGEAVLTVRAKGAAGGRAHTHDPHGASP
jgi:copper chaperone NosL